MNKVKMIKLNDGTSIPQLGFGTWQLTGQENVNQSLKSAWEAGYRHIDTAQIYNNEYEIGNFLKENNIKQDEVYLTTKIWMSNFGSKEDFKTSVKQSLRRLGVTKVNMILLHWALSKEPSINAYKWLEEVKAEGLTDSIGVSNFNLERLEQIWAVAKVKPAVNQVQFDLKNQELAIKAWCEERGVHIQGYSVLKPYLGSSTRINLSEVEKASVDAIAKKYHKTGAQLVLKFALQENIIIFPKSKSPERIKLNIDLFDFTIEEADMAALRKLNDQPEKMRMDDVSSGKEDYLLEKPPLLFDCYFIKNEDGTFSNDDSVKF